jgi:hypothetical protein
VVALSWWHFRPAKTPVQQLAARKQPPHGLRTEYLHYTHAHHRRGPSATSHAPPAQWPACSSPPLQSAVARSRCPDRNIPAYSRRQWRCMPPAGRLLLSHRGYPSRVVLMGPYMGPAGSGPAGSGAGLSRKAALICWGRQIWAAGYRASQRLVAQDKYCLTTAMRIAVLEIRRCGIAGRPRAPSTCKPALEVREREAICAFQGVPVKTPFGRPGGRAPLPLRPERISGRGGSFWPRLGLPGAGRLGGLPRGMRPERGSSKK